MQANRRMKVYARHKVAGVFSCWTTLELLSHVLFYRRPLSAVFRHVSRPSQRHSIPKDIPQSPEPRDIGQAAMWDNTTTSRGVVEGWRAKRVQGLMFRQGMR